MQVAVAIPAARLDRGTDARCAGAVVKVLAAKIGIRARWNTAMQVDGRLGVARDLPLKRMWRDQRGFRITEGSSEVQRSIIAREMIRERTEPIKTATPALEV